MAAVEVQGLRKRFGDTEALCGVDLEVPEASVLGLLGPNGAGKTTTVRILTTLLRADAGRATVDGIDVHAEPHRVRARIGLTGQYAAVEERLTGRENLRYVGRLYHLDRQTAARRADELLERFDLGDAADRVVTGYSGGMKRRLDIAMSLVARPRVLFLDEPTTGLDPRSRLAMWDLIGELVADGTTTLLTTQYLEEADVLAERIAVIDHGRVIARGTPDELKRQVGGDAVEVALTDPASADAALAVLADLATGPCTVGERRRWITVPVTDGRGMVPAVVRRLDDAGVAVDDVRIHRPTLDDVFLALTGRPADAETTEPAGVPT
ncbi:MAG: ATP-binding cassette domain-containing protein [Actinomyces sp.]|nr:MAG: ATP-binding cassette domain-containing protein [Actinomyces sp.]